MGRLALVGLLALVALVAGAQAAFGCSCFSDPDAREDLANADAAIFGEVLERRADGDRAIYRVRVIERFKGDVPDEIEIVTNASGAMCGLELGVGEQSGLLLRRDDTRWSSGLCDQRTREHLRSGTAPPQAQSRGPVRFVIGGDFGPDRVAGLDARGRLVRLGAGDGETLALAPCPGGRRVAEIVHGPGAEWSLVVRDVASLKIRRTLALDLPAERWVEHQARCDTADGRLVQIAVSGAKDRGRVISVAGDVQRARWRAGEQPADVRFGTRHAWVVADGRLLRIDPRTGAVRDLAARPAGEQVAGVAPDERSLVVAPEAVYGKPTPVSVLDARTGSVVAAAEVEDLEGAYWLGSKRVALWAQDGLRFGDRRLRLSRTVTDGIPRLVALVTAHGRQLATVAGDELRVYDDAGRLAGSVRRLFSNGARHIAMLPKPARRRARASAARACGWRGMRPPAIA